MSSLPPVCILAGGRGSRLGARTTRTPKPLLEVAGRPFLLHQLRALSQHDVSRVVLCVGHLGSQVQQIIGGERYGMQIAYSYDSPDLDGTLGAISRARVMLGERFLVLYGDTYLRIDYAATARSWECSGLPATMTVLRNEGQWDTSNVSFESGRVVAYNKRSPTPDMTWIDYGLGGLCAEALDMAPVGASDVADLYSVLADRGLLHGFQATERFYEIGSPSSLAETDAFLREATMPSRSDAH